MRVGKATGYRAQTHSTGDVVLVTRYDVPAPRGRVYPPSIAEQLEARLKECSTREAVCELLADTIKRFEPSAKTIGRWRHLAHTRLVQLPETPIEETTA